MRLLGFRALSSTFRENTRQVSKLIRAAASPARSVPSDVPLTVVLLSYRRGRNLPLQLHLCLQTPGVERVIVSHNDPSRAPPPIPVDPRVRLIVQPRDAGPIERYRVLREERGPWFLALDDDLFLSPPQMQALARALAAEPSVPHGIHGQLFVSGSFRDNVTRDDGEVDLLNRVYAFSRAHLQRYFDLLRELGVEREDELRRIDDDIVLAFAGKGRPRIHDLGPIVDCPSERRPGALWRRRDALQRRTRLTEALLALAPRASDGQAARGRALERGPRALWLAPARHWFRGPA